MAKSKKHHLERLDIARVIGALIKSEVEEESILASCLSEDLKSYTSRSIEVELDYLPRLTLITGAPVRIGGGGVVVRVVNTKIPSIHYALKIPRPSVFESGDPGQVYARAQIEYMQHAPISHQNVAQVFGAGNLRVKVNNLPVYVEPILMEWIDSPVPLKNFFCSNALHYRDAVSTLIQCFNALDAVHQRRLIHWDIKSDNLLVDGSGTVKLTDLGSSRRIDDPHLDRIAFSTVWNIPPSLREACNSVGRSGGSSRRFQLNLPDLAWDIPWLDLWMLGRELNRIFLADKTLLSDDAVIRMPLEQRVDSSQLLKHVFQEEDDTSQFVLKCIRLIIQRLTYPQTPTAERYYDSAQSVIESLSRILPNLGEADTVPEFIMVPRHALRLPVTGNTSFTVRFAKLLDTDPVKRLGRHTQLGTVSHVYPGGTHRRLEHVAGVASTTERFVRALYSDLSQPFWRLEIERADVEALIVAALLHDVGHVAFGHYLEEMEGLLRGRMHEDYALAVLAPERSQETTGGEERSASIATDREKILTTVINYWGLSRPDAVALLRRAAEMLRPSAQDPKSPRSPFLLLTKTGSQLIKNEILHSILDSSIDADKLDYLLRDSHHCGVQYAQGIDLDRFFQTVTTIPHLSFKSGVNKACFGVTRKGILPLESILIARYQMFSCVYWHHTARAETAMLQLAVQEYVGENAGSVNRLTDLLEHFRRLPDEQAVEWLRGCISDKKARFSVDRRILEQVCQTLLGERKLLYRRAFELEYVKDSKSVAVFTNLQARLSFINQATTSDEFVKRQRKFREEFTESVDERLGRKRILHLGELLIDIPPEGKDQVENVFVVDQDRVRMVQDVSPVAEAVRQTFAYWARPLRVFISPAAKDRLISNGIDKKTLSTKIWASLQAQQDLFTEAPPARRPPRGRA